MNKCLLGMMVLGFCVASSAQPLPPQQLYPWLETRQVLSPSGRIDLSKVMELTWRDSGGPEGKISVVDDGDGGKMLRWVVNIDHHNEGAYPVGWPSFEAYTSQDGSGMDFSGGTAISFKVRPVKDLGYNQMLRLILRGKEGSGMINKILPKLKPGEWQSVVVPYGRADWQRSVQRIHFYFDEVAYKDRDEVIFEIKDFELGKIIEELIPLEKGNAALSLWVGERADASSEAVFVTEGTKTLPAIIHLENQLEQPLKADAELRFRFRNVFNGKDTFQSLKLGKDVKPGERYRGSYSLDVANLKGSYYHVLCDVIQDGKSVLGIYKGSDDLYVARPNESDTHQILSLRAGMAFWVKDLINGVFMHSTELTLPHTYDPFDATPEHYGQFLNRFAKLTGGVGEGYEAGMPGLAIAAEAYRKGGDLERQRYVESLLDSSTEAMLRMQYPSGGVVTHRNELADMGIGKGGRSDSGGYYNSDQMGEWMRGLNYAALYYRTDPTRKEWVKKINQACLNAGKYIVKHCVQDGVIRHLLINEYQDGSVKTRIYHQEGRQCDVYQPRVLAGLSYTAFTLMKCGEKVPEDWWPLFDNTVKWMAAKMKPNGWFDWQCEDKVEGGCHTFLGNIYAGEGLFGVFMANRDANRPEQAEEAKKASHKAYRYVTDDCYIRGNRYRYPLEFWVGPYVYWLFTEWESEIGIDSEFRDWLEVLDKKWSVERKWLDFKRHPKWNCGRANYNSMLTISILGYLGIKDMEEIGKPWRIGE
ncbi:MAG: hypothetical protein GX561_08750 [Lentisphaerae bacterium]|jgi:hypothetical protein|nr:hypothetical protein [Lentisphaerota bacterium]